MNVTTRPPRGKPRGIGAIVLTAGGLLAGFAAAACCALPLFLGTLGLGSAWLFSAAAVAAPHRTAVLVIGGASLALAAVLLWRQRTAMREPGAWCANPWVRIPTLIGLAIGVMLLVAGYVYV